MSTMYFQLNVEPFGYLFRSLGVPPLHQVLYQDVCLHKVRSVPKRNSDAYDFSPALYYYNEALCATISSLKRPIAGSGSGLACLDER